jgi:hypothetical protein
LEAGFRPALTDQGRKHPVTRGLEGSEATPPNWSRWFRQISVDTPQGATVMSGADNAPLLVLNRVGEGRVALLLSDQGWLWARGFEGGGPHVQLYRRTAHWLMGQPELEEERLIAEADGNALLIRRQTMADNAGSAEIVTPSGETLSLPLIEQTRGSGLFSARLESSETGLFRIQNGDLTTLAHIGAVNTREYQSVMSTMAVLQPLSEATGGSTRRVAAASGVSIPNIVPVRGNAASGPDWIGLRPTGDTVLTSVSRQPLFAGFAGLGILLLALGSMWWREGR